MKLYFYRGETPNFGDELSEWLMPRVFPGLFDANEDRLFLGIGSIIFDFYPAKAEKIVFGSGYGGYTALPAFDESWRFYCVRGPRTAHACNLGPEKVAGDAAILIHKHGRRGHRSPKGFSFMPHWQSVARGHWAEACAGAGLNFIDPAGDVEQVMEAIANSEVLITEAMHGAIVADALRVPWIPILPIHALHRMKWHDWAESLDMELTPHVLWPSSVREAWIAARGGGEGSWLRDARFPLKSGIDIVDPAFVHFASVRLRQLAKREPMQSSDAALDRVLDKLETNAAQILRDYPNG